MLLCPSVCMSVTGVSSPTLSVLGAIILPKCAGSILTAAVMIGVMPRSCDPEVSWWQGSVILEIRPVTNPGVEAILDLRKLIDSVPLLSRLGFKVNLDITLEKEIDR